MSTWISNLLILGTCLCGMAFGDEPPSNPLVGTWRVVSYPTSEGDLLRRHGREPGPLPNASSSLQGWSYLVFAADGRCALFYPENQKGKPSHRRIAWQHDEDNFARWKLIAAVRRGRWI